MIIRQVNADIGVGTGEHWGTVPPVECNILTVTHGCCVERLRPKVGGVPGWAEPFRR